MTGYLFFRTLPSFFFLALFILVSWVLVVELDYEELSTEARFRRTYGADWRTKYEEVHGSLAVAHAKIAASAIGMVAAGALVVWLSKLLRPAHHSGRSSGNRRQRRRYGSRLERAVALRRKAVVGIYFGLAGIIAGVFLVIWRTGIFSDHADEVVLGAFVFLAGYAGVIAGCSSWLKAKQQNDAIVFIGLMPLVIPLIPFVRLILLATPAVLLSAMVMMPLILLVVVAALPDKSGTSRRKLWRNVTQAGLPDDETMSVDPDAARPNPPGGAHGRLPLISKTNRTSAGADPTRLP